MIKIIIICILIIFLYLLLKSFNENFSNNEYLIKGSTLSDNENLDISNVKVNIGDNTHNFDNQSQQINVQNTLFVKNSLKIGDIVLDYDKIIDMKKYPVHFNKKICLQNSEGSSCINKNQIKLLNGNLPINLKTFVNVKPFRFFTQPKYKGLTVEKGLESNTGETFVDLNVSADLPPTNTTYIQEDEVTLNELFKGASDNNISNVIQKEILFPLNYEVNFVIIPEKKIWTWGSIFSTYYDPPDHIIKVDWPSVYNAGARKFTRPLNAWFYPNSYRLHIRVGSEWNNNGGNDPPEELEEGVETKVTIIKRNNTVKIYYNNIEKSRFTIGKTYCFNGKMVVPSTNQYMVANAKFKDFYIKNLDVEEAFDDSVVRYRSLQVDKGYKIQIFTDYNYSGSNAVIEYPGIEDITKLGKDWKNGVVSYKVETPNIPEPLCLTAVNFGPYEDSLPKKELGTAVQPIFTSKKCDDSKSQKFIIETDREKTSALNKSHTHTYAHESHFHRHKFSEGAH